MKLTHFIPSDEFDQALRSALLERIGMIARIMEQRSDDWRQIQKLLPQIEQQLTSNGQQQLGELTDHFLVYGYDIGLECYKAGIKDMHSMVTSSDFFGE